MAHKASAEPASATGPDTYEAKAIALLQSKDFWSIPLEESIQKIGSKGVSGYTVEEAESIPMNAKEAADSEQSGVATLAHLRGPGTNGPGAWAPRPGSRARRTPKLAETPRTGARRRGDGEPPQTGCKAQKRTDTPTYQRFPDTQTNMVSFFVYR